MTIEIVIGDQGWLAALSDIQERALACYQAVNRFEPACSGEVSLLLTNDQHIQTLNREYRDRNAPTNVLSFPAVPMPQLPNIAQTDQSEQKLLGDIALGLEICVREAEQANCPFAHHTSHLIIHGLLHLTGYDHQGDTEAEEMENLEVKVLQSLNIANPYKR